MNRVGPQSVSQPRVGDAEREDCISMLTGYSVSGHLTLDELDARVGAALRARTSADLECLTFDLPTGGEDIERTAPAKRWIRPRRLGVSVCSVAGVAWFAQSGSTNDWWNLADAQLAPVALLLTGGVALVSPIVGTRKHAR